MNWSGLFFFVFCFFFSERRGPNESDHTCQDQTLQTKGGLFFHTVAKAQFKYILFKEKQSSGSGREKARTDISPLVCYHFGKMVIITSFVSVNLRSLENHE